MDGAIAGIDGLVDEWIRGFSESAQLACALLLILIENQRQHCKLRVWNVF